jgi:hypothetical protein
MPDPAIVLSYRNYVVFLKYQLFSEGKRWNNFSQKSRIVPLSVKNVFHSLLISDAPLLFLLKAHLNKNFLRLSLLPSFLNYAFPFVDAQ